jgi:hypothetical protein
MRGDKRDEITSQNSQRRQQRRAHVNKSADWAAITGWPGNLLASRNAWRGLKDSNFRPSGNGHTTEAFQCVRCPMWNVPPKLDASNASKLAQCRPCRRHAGFSVLHGKSSIIDIRNKYQRLMARPKRFELLTPRFVVWCSIQLSYGRFARRPGNIPACGARLCYRFRASLASAGAPVPDWQSPPVTGI